MKALLALPVSVCLILLFSCDKDDSTIYFPEEVKFDVTARLLEGKKISAIDFDNNGIAIIGSGSTVYFNSKSGLTSYEISFEVLDLATAPDNSVWVGTNGGLVHLSDGDITLYNNASSGLPRDYVSNVEVSPEGVVWFSSCAHQLGGLGIYDGRRFTFLTPENSPLNQNIITDIEISPDGDVYIATDGTVGKTNIYRISNGSWECLGDEEGTFYWTMSFALDLEENIYLVEDFSLSSTMRKNQMHVYRSGNWEKLNTDEHQVFTFFSAIKADKRNYCWVTTMQEPGPGLLVYDGMQFHESPAGLIPDGLISVIEADRENNIWVGTNSDGIFILNQGF